MLRFNPMLWALAVVCLAAGTVVADVPTNMNIQGRLADSLGSPAATGPKDFTFKIYDAEIGGTEIWPAGPGEKQTLVTNTEGLWSATVGALIPLGEAVFQDTARWLEITVDDNVHPPQALSRIKLNTGAFAYRAASAQVADSLLLDSYVNETGDSMSGKLYLVWSEKQTGASIIVSNVNDGRTPLVTDDSSGTLGIVVDAESNDVLGNVAIAAAGGGDDNPFGNYGIISLAAGAGSPNIAVMGYTLRDGTDDYSGFFRDGDFVVTDPISSGTDGVRLPNDAIDNTEILDEPGIAAVVATSGPLFSPTNASSVNIASLTITIPADGYIVIEGTASLRHSGTVGSAFAWLQISETSGAAQNATRYVWTNSNGYANSSSGWNYQSATVKDVVFKSAGSYTFYLQGNQYISNDVGSSVYPVGEQWLTATYYPRSYGTVSVVASSREGFAEAETIGTKDPLSGTESVAYQVDLRELELRAARAQAEAERAKLELLKAQTRFVAPVRKKADGKD